MIQVYTSYFSKALKNVRPETQYVIVSNSAPRWLPNNISVIWLKEFAPDWQYIVQLKNGLMEWQDFAMQYKQTILARFGTLKAAQEYFLSKVNAENIVLLCFEKDSSRCHRSLLANLLFELVYNGEL